MEYEGLKENGKRNARNKKIRGTSISGGLARALLPLFTMRWIPGMALLQTGLDLPSLGSTTTHELTHEFSLSVFVASGKAEETLTGVPCLHPACATQQKESGDEGRTMGDIWKKSAGAVEDGG